MGCGFTPHSLFQSLVFRSCVRSAVSIKNGLNSTVCNKACNNLIDFLNECFRAESECECIRLGCHVVGKDLNAGIVLAHFCCCKVVNYPSLYLTLCKSDFCLIVMLVGIYVVAL